MMVQGDKPAQAQAATGNESQEIDRIMREIEDLEKKMDVRVDESTLKIEPEAQAATPKVVALRSVETAPTESHRSVEDSMVESDAVPASDEPLMKSSFGSVDGGLGLKVSGCAQISLEFTRTGVSVSLSCDEDGLSITTDQGAEFKIPFKRAA